MSINMTQSCYMLNIAKELLTHLGKSWDCVSKKKPKYKAGKMSQQLRVLADLAEDLGSSPSTRMVANNHL